MPWQRSSLKGVWLFFVRVVMAYSNYCAVHMAENLAILQFRLLKS